MVANSIPMIRRRSTFNNRSNDAEKGDLHEISLLDSARSSRKNSENAPTVLAGSDARIATQPGGREGSIVEENFEEVPEEIHKGQKWKILVATSLQAFWVIGLTQSFGIFQRHYAEQAAVKDGIIHPSETSQRAAIATIGALGNGGIMSVFGVLWCPHLPLFGKHIKKICALGTLLMAMGFGIAAASSHLWHLILSQGLLVGIGGGALLSSLPPILAEYYGKHSGLAQGVSMAAASVGGATLSLSVPQMLDSIGTSCTLGVLAAVSTVIGILISLLAQPPRKFERRSTEVAGWGTFKEAIFTLLFIANFIHPLTVANPATFGPVFSETVGINGRDGAMLLAIVSLVGIPSRLSIGWAADVIGHTNIVIIVTGIYCIGVWCLWLPAATNNSRVLWTVFNVMYGVVNGTFNIVVNSLQKKLFGDELYYSYNGAITSIRGVGYVIGVPIAGALVKQGRDDDLSGTDFTMPIIYNGALLTIALVCLLGIRIVDARKIEWAWAR